MEKENGKSNENSEVNLVLIASGLGTDANAIMSAWKTGYLNEVNPPRLISTDKHAGCIGKAEAFELDYITIHRRDYPHAYSFNEAMKTALQECRADLVFLVGCIVKINPILGIDMYNIHPADPEKFGGKNMYGLKVHKRVLLDADDLVFRGRGSALYQYTYPTIHQVDYEYDRGHILLRQAVEIPRSIMESNEDLEVRAKKLQEHVLPYEWLMLPPAVKMAARRIIERRKQDAASV